MMGISYSKVIKCVVLAGVLGAGVAGAALEAQAQMSDKPWSYMRQNRASIAALIRSVENEGKSNGGAQVAGGIVNLVCGGDAKTSAKGNGACVILNNSPGAAVSIIQDSVGDQTASTQETTTVHETINASSETATSSGADDVLDVLGLN